MIDPDQPPRLHKPLQPDSDFEWPMQTLVLMRHMAQHPKVRRFHRRRVRELNARIKALRLKAGLD